jgi:glutathione S-transferase
VKDGDKIIFESGAVAVYIVHKANRLDLFGENSEERVHIL